MSATESTMHALGTPLPSFSLDDAVSGRTVSSTDFAKAKGLLAMFICNHCPFVIHIRPQLVSRAHQWIERGLSVVAINANSLRTHPEDGPEAMKQLAQQEKWRFPFLFDRTQKVAQAFGAACTPDFFLYDAAGRLAYRGQFDDSRPSNGKPVTGDDLNSAVEAVLSGKAPGSPQKPSIGCNIKWDAGNEPAYFGASR